MAQQVLHYWQFYAAFHEVSCKRMAQRMDAADLLQIGNPSCS
jgi:hypothetical protein